MRKIKHILTAFVFCLILSASTIPVCASAVSASNEETGYVYVLDDSADFLTDSQENSLQKQLYDLTAYCNVAFVTTTGHSKSSTEDFAADYFDDVFGPHANGTIFVIDRCLNEIYLYSDGQAHKIITNSRARSITDNTYTYARDKDYYTCAYKVFAQIETLMQGKRIAEPMRYLCSALLAIVAALFLNLFFALWSSRSHKADRRQVMTGLYAQMQINNPRTQFIRQSRTYSPVSSGSSGGGHSGGGGGGGGGTWTGEKIQISATPAPNAMGNFDVNGNNVGTNGTVGTNTGTTIEELLPQPDPTYFTQGMDNVAGFTDIGSVKWAHKAIATLRSVNVINGKETTKFCPNDSITRAEFVQILIGMLSYAERIDISDAECSFTDVASDAWYYNSVAAAVKYGIVSGISENEFAPNVLISRQDMCVMIDRACTAANITLPNGASIIFNDESNISGYALNAVRDMSKAGIVSGFEDGNFKPLENATRAQAAVIIYRMAGGAE